MLNVLKSKRGIFGICALGLAVVCAVLRLICVIFFFDSDIGYYTAGAPLPVILNILLILCVVAAFVFCLIPKISVTPSDPHTNKALKLTAIFPAVGFAGYAVLYFTWLAKYVSLYGSPSFSYILTAIATVCAAVFFALLAFRKSNADIAFVATGLLTVIWFVMALAECYFDTLVQMNSPNKLIFQFATLSAMLLTVNEMRQDLGSKRPGFHLFSAALASVFLLTSSVPSIVGYFTGNMPKSYSLLYSDAVMLLLAVFAITRLIQLCFGKEPEVITEDIAQGSDFEVISEADTDEDDVKSTEDTQDDTDAEASNDDDNTEDASDTEQSITEERVPEEETQEPAEDNKSTEENQEL